MSGLVASALGVGHLRPGPGTWGSLLALALAYALLALGGFWAFLAALVVIHPLGLWAIRRQVEGQADHDPGWIVVDEVAGQWIALLPVALGAWRTGAEPAALWPGWLAAFLLFRLFDIRKPWLVGRADRRGDAWGVMLDDTAAGAMAAAGVVALAAIAHLGLLL